MKREQDRPRQPRVLDFESLVPAARIFNRAVEALADEIYLAGGVFLRDAPDRAKERLWRILESQDD